MMQLTDMSREELIALCERLNGELSEAQKRVEELETPDEYWYDNYGPCEKPDPKDPSWEETSGEITEVDTRRYLEKLFVVHDEGQLHFYKTLSEAKEANAAFDKAWTEKYADAQKANVAQDKLKSEKQP